MRASLVLSVCFATLLLSGCSNTQTYTCAFSTSVGYCWEWTATPPLTVTESNALAASCSAATVGTGTYLIGGTCTTANRVGLCTIPYPSVGVTYQWSVYSPAYTATTGQTLCTAQGGTWTAG